ncbi:ras-related protein Rab-21 isoform X2 [Anabrus simplex]
MVVRYIGKMFSHHISPTIGASFFTCKLNIEDIRVKLQVWDTAGQERFRSMAPMYYRNANAALLVFDITQYHTFTSIKSWVKELQRNVEEPMVLCVVGNKTDLASDRKVSREEAFQYAQSIGGNYFESSALQDYGIEEVFFNTAMGLIRLSEDSLCSSLRVYDSADGANLKPNNVFSGTTTVEAIAEATGCDDSGNAYAVTERSPMCC